MKNKENAIYTQVLALNFAEALRQIDQHDACVFLAYVLINSTDNLEDEILQVSRFIMLYCVAGATYTAFEDPQQGAEHVLKTLTETAKKMICDSYQSMRDTGEYESHKDEVNRIRSEITKN